MAASFAYTNSGGLFFFPCKAEPPMAISCRGTKPAKDRRGALARGVGGPSHTSYLLEREREREREREKKTSRPHGREQGEQV